MATAHYDFSVTFPPRPMAWGACFTGFAQPVQMRCWMVAETRRPPDVPKPMLFPNGIIHPNLLVYNTPLGSETRISAFLQTGAMRQRGSSLVPRSESLSLPCWGRPTSFGRWIGDMLNLSKGAFHPYWLRTPWRLCRIGKLAFPGPSTPTRLFINSENIHTSYSRNSTLDLRTIHGEYIENIS
ncbi:hypothetical protein ASPSYDRAFT_438255 [Aspergillus sydowii CBS 593.65]|uniref:Uncharacterized protein n=1 Tax=Aspergillus sydowii CBS 593.65 TaxID=1036612 RepID=A0A1L9T6C8_9EURO|nr:uncharacterized protein ASPSYDRAFT_438255 [Aspergillus sydowii CBS 593.65]OJJ55004.1 hypothetical protein ASPSYDRAFT_438255 [Aspergillus sydowii CBS 593.65]